MTARHSVLAALAGLCIAVSVETCAAQSQPNPNDWLLNAPNDTERFRLLQNYLRGFSMPMWEVGERFQRLYDALGDKNYDFATYQWEKIREAIVLGYTKRPGRRANADSELVGKLYEPTREAFKSGDAARAAQAFSAARNACMSCHEKERVAFMNNQPLFRLTEKPPLPR
jgi:hypothetical protein